LPEKTEVRSRSFERLIQAREQPDLESGKRTWRGRNWKDAAARQYGERRRAGTLGKKEEG